MSGGMVKTLSGSSERHYAVIQVRPSDAPIERIVVAYHDERTLRQFLTKRSIIATGFSSRAEALEKSLIAGLQNRLWLLNLVSKLWVSPDYCRRHLVRMRVLVRLHAQRGPQRVVTDVVHITGAALCRFRSRLRQTLRRLEPVVQQQ